MREIKFRFYKSDDCMSGEYELGDTSIPYFMEHGYIPLQYTGLKDRNGVEIYEGDVVRGACGNYPDVFVIEYGEIRNDSLGDARDKGIGFNFHENEAEEMEVIGNIYKNPELVKK